MWQISFSLDQKRVGGRKKIGGKNRRNDSEKEKVRERESDGKGGRKDKELDFQIIEEWIELKIELNPIISLFLFSCILSS